jgi:hypothetical protein
MKKIYVLGIVFSLGLLYGCSKDFLKSYDKRIIGTWRISAVNRVGVGGGGDIDNLPFHSGFVTFYENGTLDYTNSANILFKGTWDIVKKRRDDQTFRSLQITAIDFANQVVLSQYYDDMNFVGTDHFKANIISNFHTYVTHFRR